MTGVLEGLRVVEGSAFVAVPLAGMTLAQMGADVIRFDRIGGGLDAGRWPVTTDGRSLFWAGLNKGKRSFAVNLSDPRGQELVAALICDEASGCYLTNLGQRPPLSYKALAERRADVIVVSLSGTRAGGPAVDYTVNPSMGFPMATGPEGSTDPVAHVLPAWDCIAGQMVVNGLLAAERHRLRTGAGQLVELSLKDVAGAMLGNLGIIGEVAVNGVDRPKYGNALYGAYGADFATADGRRVMVIGLTTRQWKGLMKATGTGEAMAALADSLGTDFNDEGARFTHRHAISQVLRPWFSARRLADFAADFDAAGLTWSEFRSFAQALAEDPDLGPDNPMFGVVDQPGIGAYPVPASPLAFSASARPPPAPAPLLGQHTEAILADVLGLPSAEIGRLMDAGVVAGPGQG